MQTLAGQISIDPSDGWSEWDGQSRLAPVDSVSSRPEAEAPDDAWGPPFLIWGFFGLLSWLPLAFLGYLVLS